LARILPVKRALPTKPERTRDQAYNVSRHYSAVWNKRHPVIPNGVCAVRNPSFPGFPPKRDSSLRSE
jgi:hypothetical protein